MLLLNMIHCVCGYNNNNNNNNNKKKKKKKKKEEEDNNNKKSCIKSVQCNYCRAGIKPKIFEL